MGATALLLIGMLIVVALGLLYWAMKERGRIELLEGDKEEKVAPDGDKESWASSEEGQEAEPEQRGKEACLEEEPATGSEEQEVAKCGKENGARPEQEEDEEKVGGEPFFSTYSPGAVEDQGICGDSQRATE